MRATFRTRSILWAFLVLACGELSAVGVISSAADVRELKREEADKGLPVKLKGVVTFVLPGHKLRNIIIEQSGTGIFVSVSQAALWDEDGNPLAAEAWPVLEIGTEIEVRGETRPGQYAPVIDAREVRVTGRGEPAPPRKFVAGEVMSGSMDCQRIELKGVVQSADFQADNTPFLRMEVAVATGRFVVETPSPGNWTPEKLLGRTVRIEAVALTYFNVRGELLGVHFMVARPEDITVEKEPAEPFSEPPVPVDSLLAFSPSGPNLERVRISGVVTISRPGRYLYLEENGRAVRVLTREPMRFSPGDLVEASGFTGLHQSFAELREALVRRVRQGEPSAAMRVNYRGLLDAMERKWGEGPPADFNGRLVSIDGTMTAIEPMADGGRRMLIATDGDPVVATLDAGGDAEVLDRLQIGSEVRLTGVCELQFAGVPVLADFPNPTGFSLLLRSAGDLEVLHEPSWWTPARLWLLLGGAFGLLVLATVWNFVLRNLVRKRSAQLAAETRARDRAEIEFDATLRERTRLAADLHDTIEQALTGLSFQLDTSKVLAVKSPEASSRHLELGRQLLSRSREDLRRSIWNLRSRELEGNSLLEGIRSVALLAAEGRMIEITVEEAGPVRAIPEFIAGNLLLLAQEAITNAIKHGGPKRILVSLEHSAGSLSLSVNDDGDGFDPSSAPGLSTGHFGLQGMKERANRLDGEIEIESTPGKGSRIRIRVPVASGPAN